MMIRSAPPEKMFQGSKWLRKNGRAVTNRFTGKGRFKCNASEDGKRALLREPVKAHTAGC
jgi:hypothetical protein